jgi:hypothetical protein
MSSSVAVAYLAFAKENRLKHKQVPGLLPLGRIRF